MNHKVLTIGVAVLTALLALIVTGMAAFAGGQAQRMSDQEVRVAVRTAVDSAERRGDVHTERLLNDQEDAHRKELKAARKQAREHGYRVGKKSGYQDGNEAGYSSGYSSGNSAGIETGKDEATDEVWCSDDSDVDLPACTYPDVDYEGGWDY